MRQIGHGADLLEMCEIYGVDPLRALDFSANINVHTPSKLMDLLKKCDSALLRSYPDYRYKGLREKISQRYRVNANQIIVGNGATELIYLLCRCRKWKKIGIMSPSFSEYENAARHSEKNIKFLNYDREFKIPSNFFAQLDGVDLLILCNPNNPTGRLEKLTETVNYCAEHGIVLAVDETFLEFSFQEDQVSVIPVLEKYKGELLVLRAMTKFYSVPGLRLGYGFATPNLIKDLWEAKEPWTVNAFSEVLVECLFDKEYIRRSKDFYQEEIAYMNRELEKVPKIQAVETSTNFVLLRIEEKTSMELKEQLFCNKKILIRDCSNFRGLDDHYFRINIQTREKNKLLLQGLHKEVSY